MKILVTGHIGMLGSELMESLRTDHEVMGVDLQEMDVTDLNATRKTLSEFKPEVVYHTASYNAVDPAETNWETPFQVNTVGSMNVAIATREVGGVMVSFSTDYVFDGTKNSPYLEDDAPNPLGIYARSKAAAEQMVRTLIPEHYIVRVSWLIGHNGSNFVETILRLAGEGKPLSVVNDQTGSPAFCTDVISDLKRLVSTKAYGTYHLSCNGECTWYDLAKTIVEESGLDVPVTPVTTEQFGRPAPRPRYSYLRNAKMEATIGDKMPQWRDGLKRYLSSRP
jgi:dTDP-4-dehydrorhamnose reductase